MNTRDIVNIQKCVVGDTNKAYTHSSGFSRTQKSNIVDYGTGPMSYTQRLCYSRIGFVVFDTGNK